MFSLTSSKHPNWEPCKMLETTSVRCKNRPAATFEEIRSTNHGISQSFERRQRIKDSTSPRRNRARHLSCWIQSYPAKKKVPATLRAYYRVSCLPHSNLVKYTQTVLLSSFFLAKICAGITTLRHPSLRDKWNSRKSCSESNRRDNICLGTIWSHRRIVKRCNVMLLQLAQRA